ncbi:MAG: hypothetical protein KUG57_01370, partial [Ilumatobacteraceae bacterium]|nr:hypothetical protein [Ilumatobacteraceae bacterium]
MSNETSAPLPGRLVGSGLNKELAQTRGVTRRQVVGGVIGLTGIALLLGVAPNITDDTKAFAFEPPPDALEISFSPVLLISLIGVWYVAAGVMSFLPARFDRLALI